MDHRELGDSGIEVSEIGFGAWVIGTDWWGDRDESDALELVDTLRPELGSVDYADMHGAGEGLEFAREVKHWSWYTINER